MNQNKLIIALDEISEKKARDIISEISEACSDVRNRILYKFNDLVPVISSKGMARLAEKNDIRLMIDSKWHEIPNTMENYIYRLASEGLADYTDYVTIHSSAGKTSVKAIVEKRDELQLQTRILAVTVLTSMPEQEVENIYKRGINDNVLNLGGIALESGVDGLVCSPLELQSLRKEYGEELLLVTPGVRPTGSEIGDQTRNTTPKQAIENGADDIVVGRPIVLSENHSDEVKKIFKEMNI